MKIVLTGKVCEVISRIFRFLSHVRVDVMMFRSGNNQLGERPSGKGREHPPRRTISLLSDFFVNCLHCDSSDLYDLHDYTVA
ncbi:MAG: hypothetical protein LBH72_01225, partial [Proteiniphilum sp.]|nr:hypothetical protein [Proteiniphilum sp.]